MVEEIQVEDGTDGAPKVTDLTCQGTVNVTALMGWVDKRARGGRWIILRIISLLEQQHKYEQIERGKVGIQQCVVVL